MGELDAHARADLLAIVGDRLHGVGLWNDERWVELAGSSEVEVWLFEDIEAALARYHAMLAAPHARGLPRRAFPDSLSQPRKRGRPRHEPSHELACEAARIFDKWVRAPRSSGGNTLTTWQQFLAVILRAAGSPLTGEKLARTLGEVPTGEFEPDPDYLQECDANYYSEFEDEGRPDFHHCLNPDRWMDFAPADYADYFAEIGGDECDDTQQIETPAF